MGNGIKAATGVAALLAVGLACAVPAAATPLDPALMPPAEIAPFSEAAPIAAPTLVPTVKPASLAALVDTRTMPAAIDGETECLAGAVYFESRSEPLDGQLAVAEVVINRAQSGRFPETLCGVVYQPYQFSFVRGGAMPPIRRESEQWRRAVAIAGIAREELWDSSVADALFFHASRISPRWRLKRIAQVGNHIFYR